MLSERVVMRAAAPQPITLIAWCTVPSRVARMTSSGRVFLANTRSIACSQEVRPTSKASEFPEPTGRVPIFKSRPALMSPFTTS